LRMRTPTDDAAWIARYRAVTERLKSQESTVQATGAPRRTSELGTPLGDLSWLRLPWALLDLAGPGVTVTSQGQLRGSRGLSRLKRAPHPPATQGKRVWKKQGTWRRPHEMRGKRKRCYRGYG
jgi:hypothetical protein